MVTNRVGPVVRHGDFYGREQFVQLVWEKLSSGHVLLAAPRRFGKTSVMYNLMDYPAGPWRFVHVDCEDFREPGSLVTELVVQIAQDNGLHKIAEALTYFPRKLWSEFKQNFAEVALWKFKVKLRDQVSGHWQDSGDELFGLLAKADKPIVVVLDELAMMLAAMTSSKRQQEEARLLLRWLRKIRMGPGAATVHFLVAGSVGIDHLLSELGESGAMADFERMKLDPFSRQVAAAFLTELSTSHDFPISAIARNRMLDLIGTLVPFFLQIMFSEVRKACLIKEVKPTPAVIETIYRGTVLGVDCKGYFDHYHGRLREYYRPKADIVRRLLRELAVKGAMTRKACHHLHQEFAGKKSGLEDFNVLMTNLENDFYIRYDATTKRYEFASKILRDWWLRHYGMEAD